MAWDLKPSAYLETVGDRRPERPPEVFSLQSSREREERAGARSIRDSAPVVTSDQLGHLREGQHYTVTDAENPSGSTEAIFIGGKLRKVIAAVREDDEHETERTPIATGDVDASGEQIYEDAPMPGIGDYDPGQEPSHDPGIVEDSGGGGESLDASPQEPGEVSVDPPPVEQVDESEHYVAEGEQGDNYLVNG